MPWLLIIILLLLFGGGGGYYGYHHIGPGVGVSWTVLIVILCFFILVKRENR